MVGRWRHAASGDDAERWRRAGCSIKGTGIANADPDFGAATRDGSAAYLTDRRGVTLRDATLRGRRNGQFPRAIRCTGLRVTGEVWDAVPGNSTANLVQLEDRGDCDVDLIVRSASGARIGTLRATNTDTDAGIQYAGPTGALAAQSLTKVMDAIGSDS